MSKHIALSQEQVESKKEHLRSQYPGMPEDVASFIESLAVTTRILHKELSKCRSQLAK